MSGRRRIPGVIGFGSVSFPTRLDTKPQRLFAASSGPSIIAVGGSAEAGCSQEKAVEVGPEWRSRYRWGPNASSSQAESSLSGLFQNDYLLIMEKTGIHEAVVGPCRTAAAALGWVLMFRDIKRQAMEYVGQVDMLPKPYAIKRKAHPEIGVIAYTGSSIEQKDRELASDPKIEDAFKTSAGLRIDHDGSAAKKLGVKLPTDTSLLVDARGRAFYSDMDLFQVLDANSGTEVRVGDGEKNEAQSAENRQTLDAMISPHSALAALGAVGVEYGLIQHGADRQWVNYERREEAIAAICPDGSVWGLANMDIALAFERQIRSDGGYNPEACSEHFLSCYLGG